MTTKPTSERDFENAIEAWLLEQAGYTRVDNRQFDPALAINKHTLLAFRDTARRFGRPQAQRRQQCRAGRRP